MRKFFFFLLIPFWSLAQVDTNLKTLTASGTDSYTVTEASPSSYTDKERWLIRFTNACVTCSSATLNRAGLGAKSIKDFQGNALGSGSITANSVWLLTYNSSLGYYQVIGDGGSGGGGGGTWGSITGTLSNQTDLQNALNAKVSTTLTSGHIYVGNASNVATDVALSGDATLSSAGAITVTKINGTSLAGLATGILKNTTGTGVPSIAVANTDYLSVASPAYTGTLTTGTLGYSDTGILGALQSSTNSYNQLIIQNTSSGASASTNLNVSNNNATSTTNFGEFGINSSGFTGTGAFSQAGNVYLASASTDLVIGTYGSNAIHFVVNSGSTDAATISSAGVLTLTSTPVFSSGIGSATATTQSASDNSTKVATTAYVDNQISVKRLLPSTTFDGQGSIVQINSIRYFRVLAATTITGWSIIAEGSSPTCTIDVYKIASGTTLPTSSITASAQPALSTGNAVKSTTLTGWTTSWSADDMIAVKVTACSAATKITFQFYQ
jgi:hypothetical protein